MTITEMIAEWRKGCSSSIGAQPAYCPVCTGDLIEAIEEVARNQDACGITAVYGSLTAKQEQFGAINAQWKVDGKGNALLFCASSVQEYVEGHPSHKMNLERLAEIERWLNHPDIHHESARDLRREKNQILFGSPYLPEQESEARRQGRMLDALFDDVDAIKVGGTD